MPRAPRNLVSGHGYHLTARGVDKRDIFLDDDDRRRFVLRLGVALEERAVSCLAYCLMGNHVHLVLHGEGVGISGAMRDVLGGHARYFNQKYDRVGHLFGGRFHDVRVQSDAQVHAVVRYVALNPVTAGLVPHPRDWPWGSYAAVLRGLVQPGTLDLRLLARLLCAEGPSLGEVAQALMRTVDVGLADARRLALTPAP